MKEYNVEIKKNSSGGREILPAGGYVCQIQGARIEEGQYGSTLVIAHDVCEGDYKGFFKKDYENNDREDKKWRGTFRLRLPNEDGSQQDEWKAKALGNTIWALEESNPGFKWDWANAEKQLKGKKIGLLYRNKEWEFGGRTGWTTEAVAAESIEDIRAGKFRIPKDKPLPEKPAAPVFTEVEDDDGSLPF